MKNQISNFTQFRAYDLSEFEWFDGETFINFNLIGIDLNRKEAPHLPMSGIKTTIGARNLAA